MVRPAGQVAADTLVQTRAQAESGQAADAEVQPTTRSVRDQKERPERHHPQRLDDVGSVPTYMWSLDSLYASHSAETR